MSAPSCWTPGREPAFDGFAVEWAEPGRFILSRRNRLFSTAAPGAPLTPLCSFPASPGKSLLSTVRAVQRLLRFSFYNVVSLPDGSFFLSFDRSVGILRDGEVRPVPGLIRSARILRGACAVDASGDLYFGEYLSNRHHGPVYVYRLPAGSDRLEVVRRFEAGEALHVHGIYADPFEGGLWCVTGDRPDECRILRTMDGFRTFEVIGKGDETWRCVSLQFTRDAIYYGSDAEFSVNHLYRLSRRTGDRDMLTELEGPVYYSTRVGDDLFFGVSAEIWSPSQLVPNAAIWHVVPGGSVTRIVSLKKDLLPGRLFLPGTIDFAGGPGLSDRVFFHGVALKGADTRCHMLRRRSSMRDNVAVGADILDYPDEERQPPMSAMPGN
jgi:hypothetical protein